MKKKAKIKKFVLALVIAFGALIALVVSFYFYSLTPVSNNNDIKKFTIEYGMGKNEIANSLKEAELIRNSEVTIIYMQLNKTILKAGTYELKESMSTQKIISIISDGNSLETKGKTLTFIEGKDLVDYAKVISDNYAFSQEEVTSALSNKDFLNKVISKYWFVGSEVLNDALYYPLEGYLYPDTYNFSSDASIEDIALAMLDNAEKKIKDLEQEIENSKYSYHELLTLASIVEQEGKTSEDRALIAGVFYNRLNKGQSLGSDITTYYASHKDLSEELTIKELNEVNDYNTRAPSFIGLPIGPVCNPGITSIKAVIEPTNNDYYYFYASNNGKIYYSKTYEEHINTINKLEG